MNQFQQAMEKVGDLAVAQAAERSFLLPPQGSVAAESSDFLFNFITYVSLFFFVVIVIMMVWFCLRYARKDDAEMMNPSAHHNLPLEIAWSIIPGFLLIYMFYMGYVGYMDMVTPPDDAYEIKLQARQWSWTFTYPNGHETTTLYAPVDTPVVLTMRSSDVLHSFFVPEFRQKMDIVPGKYSKTWFEATMTTPPDEPFHLFCAEYCGTDHSNMLADVIILGQREFEDWLAKDSNWREGLTPAEAGEKVATLKGCFACHTVDGTPSPLAPTWAGVFGSTRKFTDGTTAVADENYIRDSILNSASKIVDGFPPVMPSFQGQISEEEIVELIEFIKSLK